MPSTPLQPVRTGKTLSIYVHEEPGPTEPSTVMMRRVPGGWLKLGERPGGR